MLYILHLHSSAENVQLHVVPALAPCRRSHGSAEQLPVSDGHDNDASHRTAARSRVGNESRGSFETIAQPMCFKPRRSHVRASLRKLAPWLPVSEVRARRALGARARSRAHHQRDNAMPEAQLEPGDLAKRSAAPRTRAGCERRRRALDRTPLGHASQGVAQRSVRAGRVGLRRKIAALSRFSAVASNMPY